MTSDTKAVAWHTANWGIWGWAETILKLIGIAIGVYFLAVSWPIGFNVGFNARLVAIILVALISLLSLVIITMRYGQRETISFSFAILNAIGHFSVLLALISNPVEKTLPVAFAVSYLLAEVTKHVFLTSTGYTEAGRSPQQMLQIPRGLIVVYLLIGIFSWL
jgi:hypothetical protein